MTNTKRQHKHEDGMYHINGKKYQQLVGSRAQVWHHTAFKTPGGLTRKGLLKNKHGNIVSLKKHKTEKRLNRLGKAGYKPKKGKFVLMRKKTKRSRR